VYSSDVKVDRRNRKAVYKKLAVRNIKESTCIKKACVHSKISIGIAARNATKLQNLQEHHMARIILISTTKFVSVPVLKHT